MFTVYHSNQVDVLKSLLVQLIQREPLDNPFEAEQILVQSPGMSQWLKMELAKEFGVAANLNFPLPATFIWQLFTQVLPEVPKRSAFNKEAMTWKLMKLLPEKLAEPEFAPLKRYLTDDDDQSKRYQLAEKIADIFDGYLVYRPEWIAAWEREEVVEELNGEHPWQPILWKALYDKTLGLKQSHYHRANMYDRFIEILAAYQNGDVHLQHKLPKRLFVFGITALPPRYIDALRALGEHIDVHLMFTNPCRYYWGDLKDRTYLAKLAAQTRQCNGSDETTLWLKGSIEDNELSEVATLHTKDAVGNSLLASMGKLGRDNLYLLSQQEANDIDAFVDINNNNLLHSIQQDIYELQEHQDDNKSAHTSDYKPVISPEDTSLQVHVCHSPMREVEVLHDRLLAMFDADPSLKPRDIIVMVADINAYSHAIQAVFGNAPNERFIPYSISDRSVDQENPIIQAFMRLMALPSKRCHASELLELLEVPAVMDKFEISEDEFERVSMWVQEVGIRWGLDEKTGSQFDLPQHESSKQNTWLFGIERMLLGYAMPEAAGLYQSLTNEQMASFEEVQGMEAELAGKVAKFVRQLQLYRDRLSNAQTYTNWHHYLLSMLDDFFLVELEGEVVLNSIRHSVDQLGEQLTDAAIGKDEVMSPQVLEQYLQNHLSGARVSQRFLAGQVNFCTLMPMRSIPFKAVCLLGMNDGLYPRTVPADGFDLIQTRTRQGDRSRRDDDRYLFLEALLSAQDYLYISYVGRSIQDNSEKEPSVLVAELMEYCQQNYALDGYQDQPSDESGKALVNELTHVHPLVPFSQEAFNGQDPALTSYAKEWLPAAKMNNAAVTEEQDDFIQPLEPYFLQLEKGVNGQYELEVQDLLRFWRLPVKYFFNQRLKTYLDISLSSVQQIDEEPFALNGLDSYMFGESVLSFWQQQALQSGEDLSLGSFSHSIKTFLQRHQAQGNLPMANFGEIAAQTLLMSTEPLAQELLPFLSKSLADIEVELEVPILLDSVDGAFSENIRLNGWLKGICKYEDKQVMVRYRNGGIHSSNLLGYWLEHLCLNASGHFAETHLFGIKKGQVEHFVLSKMEVSAAREYLIEFVTYYFKGMNAPLWFIPKTAFKGLDEGYDKSGSWIGFSDVSNSLQKERKEKSFKKMQEAFDGNSFTGMSGDGDDPYVQRVWKQLDDELLNQLLAVAEKWLKPIYDYKSEITIQ
ncbi:MAG: exodeoxyribonuclease V subunit gamma [Vibrio sp.]